MALMTVVAGEAVVKKCEDGTLELRCRAPRSDCPDDPKRKCNKLLCKDAGKQIAGRFQCERCKQEVVVRC